MSRHYNFQGFDKKGLFFSTCPICASEQTRNIGTDNGYSVNKCGNADCKFVYVNPRPNADELLEFYSKYFPEEDVVPERWREEMAGIFSESIDWLGVPSHSKAELIDVGCAFGHFIEVAKKRGWSITGVEPSGIAANHAQQKYPDSNILNTSFEDAILRNEGFDALVSFYVLEHVSDPRLFVEKCFNILRPGGTAVIRVPFAEPIRPLNQLLGRPIIFAPMHLNDFSPTSMNVLAKNVGFRSCRVKSSKGRRSSDLLENVCSRTFGELGRAVDWLSRGRLFYPFSGAYSYILEK